MRKVEKAFAVGAVAVVITVGGLLYALYPNGLAAHSADRSDDPKPSNTVADKHLMAPSNGTTGEGPGSFAPQIPNVPLPSDGLGDY